VLNIKIINLDKSNKNRQKLLDNCRAAKNKVEQSFQKKTSEFDLLTTNFKNLTQSYISYRDTYEKKRDELENLIAEVTQQKS
jgi:hypothetical protein